MILKNLKRLYLCVLFLPALAAAGSPADTVAGLQHDWAIAQYQLSGDDQVAAFETLIERANAAAVARPDSADILIWNGIIKSSFAGVKGGLGALSMVKEARSSLEAAMRVDATALDGSAYTSLGALYYQVPGWPVGFGSDKKAVQFLQKGLEINPDGIDSNYFYADYLLKRKDYENAEKYLLKAQNATPRPERPIADSGRQQEIVAALSLAREKLHRTGS
jgi:tetratricopeptide (TPR) repeat protein